MNNNEEQIKSNCCEEEIKYCMGNGGCKTCSKCGNHCIDNKAPMGVSQWRNHGKEFGYWEFFEKEAIEKGREEMLTLRGIEKCFNDVRLEAIYSYRAELREKIMSKTKRMLELFKGKLPYTLLTENEEEARTQAYLAAINEVLSLLKKPNEAD
jgi:hypothetical protein